MERDADTYVQLSGCFVVELHGRRVEQRFPSRQELDIEGERVLRLSALYAALDRCPFIQLSHLQAALALWDYCSYSAGSLFGSSVADSVADRILEALQAADHGLTRKQIRDLFRGHLGSSSIDQALEKLRSLGLATYRYVPGRGRYSTLWSAADYRDPEPAEEETAGLEEFLWEET